MFLYPAGETPALPSGNSIAGVEESVGGRAVIARPLLVSDVDLTTR